MSMKRMVYHSLNCVTLHGKEDFEIVIKIINLLTDLNERLPRWAWPNQASPLNVGLEDRERTSQKFKVTETLYCWPGRRWSLI